MASRWQIRSTTGTYDSPVWDSGSSSPATSITVPSGELSYSTTYHWQVSYEDNSTEWSGWSSEWSFTTVDPPDEPPVVTTGEATGIGTTLATLNGNLANRGTAESVSVSFEYGQDQSYGATATAPPMTAVGAFSADLTGLAPGTVYHFRASAVGDGTDLGADQTFTTGIPDEPPVVTTGTADVTGTTSATLNGNLADPGTAESVSVSFEWGLTTDYSSTTDGQS